jgi:hypothetical protein
MQTRKTATVEQLEDARTARYALRDCLPRGQCSRYERPAARVHSGRVLRALVARALR